MASFPNQLKGFLGRFSKAIGALVGGLTPTVVIGLLAIVGVHLDPAVAIYLTPVIAAIGSAVFPKNDYGTQADTQTAP